MADAQVSDACGFLYVWVQVPSSAPKNDRGQSPISNRSASATEYLQVQTALCLYRQVLEDINKALFFFGAL